MAEAKKRLLKGEFLTILRVEDHNGGRDWLLMESLVYRDSRDRRWMAESSALRLKDDPKFWTWNGASIPRFFWRVFGSPFCGKHRRASVLHDYFWEQARKQAEDILFTERIAEIQGVQVMTYRIANWIFWDAMIACGEPRWSAYCKWLATAFWSSFKKGGWV